ncbi:hypothetical protein R69658_00078 [Paraburkholderia aspalathi]|uniref:Uncharacterized protein n=1 Tax=Paraburkholderia aspalathi TaxID=1324617 RepID=A0A1I7C1F8_9BURK|nr:hypothetical protein R69658_00078 [Paraburkholderia aspalathi]CAE6771057.1 hypothetical protein R69746_03846 [Paraburkholderia aspalathi]SFT93256.1 hypothetical protein SAMN05192563_1005351 [Paraburkholderia aspalathi]
MSVGHGAELRRRCHWAYRASHGAMLWLRTTPIRLPYSR